MREMIADVVIAVIGAEAFINFIKYLIDRYDRKHQSPEKLMLRALGSERLRILLKRWLHSDVRTASQWEIIETMYQGYVQLGGNGEIKKLYDECAEIKTTE